MYKHHKKINWHLNTVCKTFIYGQFDFGKDLSMKRQGEDTSRCLLRKLLAAMYTSLMSQLKNSSQYSRLQRCAALHCSLQCICINQSILGYCSLMAETHERAIKFTVAGEYVAAESQTGSSSATNRSIGSTTGFHNHGEGPF